MRLRIDLAYDGTGFHGWAAQPQLRTVQGVLEEWIGRVLRLDTVSLTVAGRTDAGVHARGQVCHLDLPDDLPLDEDPCRVLARRLDRVLPDDISIRSVRPAPAGFDARFSATWRRYIYRIVDAGHLLDPLLRSHVVRVPHPVNVDALNAGASTLLGLRDFAPFCKPRDGATTIRQLRHCQATRRSDGVIAIELAADAFCHSMVRSLVGALTAVGGAKRTLAWLEAVAAHPVRHNEVLVMPAHGLVLEEVGYPADSQLAERAQQARAMRSVEEMS